MKVLRWMIINFSTLGMFLYGTINNVDGLVNISVFIFWIAAITGMFGFFHVTAKETLNKYPDWKPSVPQYIGVTFDIVALFALLFYGYIWLGVFYFLHILGLHELFKNIKKLKEEQC